MSKNSKKDLLVLDIDGCLIHGFDGKGLNQAAFFEQTKNQPANVAIMEYLKEFCNNLSEYYVVAITGRKRSVYEDITREQLKEIGYYIHEIIYAPEDLTYEPMSNYYNWKLPVINEQIKKHNPRRTYILEDDLKMMSYFTNPNNSKVEFWFVVKDLIVLKTKSVPFIPC